MWLLQNLVAFDRLANAFTGGSADETLSSRAWRAWRDGRMPGLLLKPVIDAAFRLLRGQHHHCEASHSAELGRLNPMATVYTAGRPLTETIRKGQ